MSIFNVYVSSRVFLYKYDLAISSVLFPLVIGSCSNAFIISK